jgi:peptidyl-prolyl cis-trans isomerase C
MLKKVLSCTTALGLFIGMSGISPAQEQPADKPAAAVDQKKIDELKTALGSLNIDLKTIKNDTVVARVGKKTFTAEEVGKTMEQTLRTASQSMGPEFVKTLTPEILFLIAREQLIDLYLVDQEVAAKKATLEKQPEVQEAIADAINRVLQEALLKEETEKYVSKDAIRKKYEEFSKQFPADAEEIHLRMIVLKTDEDAKKIIDQLNAGGDFLKLARENSIEKQTAAKDGDLGYVNEITKSSLLPGFEVIFEKKDGKPVMAAGTYTKTAIKTPMGFVVLKAEDRRPLKKPKLSDLEPVLKEVLRQEAVQKMQEALKKKAGNIERLHPNTGKPMQSLEDELKAIQAKLAPADGKAAAPAADAKAAASATAATPASAAKPEEKPADKK